MSRLLFENSKFALGFAGVTLGGAALFAAFGGDSFAPSGEAQSTSELAEVSQSSAKPRPKRVSANQPEIEDFVADEDLIDNTAGFDPTPDQGKEVADLEFVDDDDGGFDDEDDLGFGDNDSGSSSRDVRASSTPRPRPTSSRPSRSNTRSSRPTKVTVRNQGNGPKVTVSENVKIR